MSSASGTAGSSPSGSRAHRSQISQVAVVSRLPRGIAALLVVAIVTAWPLFSRDLIDISRQDVPYILMLFSILIAGVPLLVMWKEQTRRPIQLL